ncbi:MAG: hypothetical protein ACE5NP_10465 [Anaerolineae bacterium]
MAYKEYPALEIVDIEGNEQDSNWLERVWGAQLKRAEDCPDGRFEPGVPLFRIVRIEEKEGPATQMVRVVDADGNPLSGVHVARTWPGVEDFEPHVQPRSRWYNNGVFGMEGTDANGLIGFGMGRGDYLKGPGTGVSSVWILSGEYFTDILDKLGMMPETNHRTLLPTFRLTEVTPEEPGPAPELPNEAVNILIEFFETAANRLRQLGGG